MTLEGIEDGGRDGSGAPAGPIDVLHVDDEQSQVELAVEFFERAEAEFAVRTATSPDEALAELAEAQVDCVISDYQMPGMDGLEFFEAVRERHPDVPLVLFTGKGSEAVASRAISMGVADYIEKEVGTAQYDRLAQRVREIVAGGGDGGAAGARDAGGNGSRADATGSADAGGASGTDGAAGTDGATGPGDREPDVGAGTDAGAGAGAETVEDGPDPVDDGLTAEIAGEGAAAGGSLDERQYERLLDGLPGGAYVVRDGAFVYANATFAQTVGYQPEQLTGGMGLADLCEADRAEIEAERPADRDAGVVTYQVRGERAIGGAFTLGIRERRAELDGESVVVGLALDLSD